MCEQLLHLQSKIVDLFFVYVSFVPPRQGENKPILMKIGRVIPTGWLDPVAGDECLKFMTSWGGREGGSIGRAPLSFVPLENPDSEMRAKRRDGETARLQGEKAATPLWRTNEVANCHRKPLSLLLQFANSKQATPAPDREMAKALK